MLALTDTQATTEKLLEEEFSMLPMLRLYIMRTAAVGSLDYIPCSEVIK
jgi:hypothetical protein